MVKLQSSKNMFFIAIPKLIVKKKGWKKGQELIASFDQDGNVVLLEV
jgi:hypothetical protein